VKLTKRELKKLIKELEKIRGRHTELVSVYVPAGYDIVKIYQHLMEEQGTAKNIKDAKTRGNVISSLDKAVRMLKDMGKTPQNGLAVFSGNVSQQDNKIEIQAWVVEPPDPLNIRMYRCDQRFVLDPLRDMMEHKEMYGLIVMDRREATIGLLKGTRIDMKSHMTSGVPGKFKAGGQCQHPDTLIMLDDGKIIKIKDAHNPGIVISENFNQEIIEPTAIIAKWENKKELFKVITCYPKVEIKTSKEHTFFVRTDKGIEEKQLSDIKIGDYLVMPEKINLNLSDQRINFKPIINKKPMKKVNIPKKINPKISRILGYYLGDGSYEIDRLTFFEQREEVAKYYKALMEDVFKIKVDLRFRKSKNYHQIRVYSRIITQFINTLFSERKKTLEALIPDLLLKSSDKSLAAFVGGFFDAEGYISKGRVAFGINNELLAKQLQLALIRIGIISSVSEYDNRRNPYSDKVRYTLSIDDTESVIKFYNSIGFVSKEKQNKVKELINARSNRNKVRQLVVNGIEVARILRNSGLTTTQFDCSSFFTNKRQISKKVFKKNILDKIKQKDLRRRLSLFYTSNLIAVKISNIKSIGVQKTIDIETKNHNYIANGLVVHNSSQRLERLIDGMALDFYKKVAQRALSEFLPLGNAVKGILVGGPGPTKESFVKELNTELKRKIVAVKDLTYTDESGLQDLVELSQENIAGEIIIEEKKIMTRFFDTLAKSPSRASYGRKDVMEKIKMGAAEIVLISEEVEDDVLEEFEEAAGDFGATVRLISIDTREGKQLFELGRFAAILRYSVGE